MSRIAPEQCSAFHVLCVEAYRKQHPAPNFQDPATFQPAEQHYLQELAEQQVNLDLLILDEAQDLHPEWLDGLIPC